MIDSRAKGRTAEMKARNELRKLTRLNWERVPMSGALDAKHGLKGDLYVPDADIKYCVEVKHYAEDHFNSKILTSKNPQFIQWWKQTIREADEIDKLPLLLFKYNRSKWFVAFDILEVSFNLQDAGRPYFILYPEEIYVCMLEDFCDNEDFVE
jgi:hypothetical protein